MRAFDKVGTVLKLRDTEWSKYGHCPHHRESPPRQASAGKELGTGSSARAQEGIVSQGMEVGDGEMEVREGSVGRGDT